MSGVLSVSEMFGRSIFNDAVMKDRLPRNVHKRLKKTIEDSAELDPSIADVVVHAMEDWAAKRGVTHYTHWFQPLTGMTAEKHDSFIPVPNDGKVIMEFSDKESTKGEPDTSFFPSGGLRATFEARGYTVWDCSSPTFLRENATDVIFYVPISFCSCKGEPLDKKTPLSCSMQAVNEQALRIFRLPGNTTTERVASSVGAEQEYFLVDREKYLQRKDLVYTGHTLFGAMSPEGQELEGRYFGATRERIGSYTSDVNKELWRLGAPAKTQHNEVALTQHELAPIYEGANQVVDRNQIAMKTLRKVTERHDMACLLHEKPFVGVNGSNKHNNWSLTADGGTNLLGPGDMPHENIQFLLILICIIRAVNVHADLLRKSAADVGDDHRLGANGAPPVIISIFLGEQLEDVIDQLCSTGEATHSKKGGILKTGIGIPPNLDKDVTDRNRTSSLTFTNDEFKLRVVDSSGSIASPNTVLNTIVIEALKEATDKLEKAGGPDMVTHDSIKEAPSAHRRTIFSGNGYTNEWVVEMEQKGLPNIWSMVDVIPALITDRTVKLFEEFCVFTRAGLKSRAGIEYENYSKVINIEARTMYDMAGKSITPTAIKYATGLTAPITVVKSACPNTDASTQTEFLLETSNLLSETKTTLSRSAEMMEKAAAAEGGRAQTLVYHQNAIPATAALRAPANQPKAVVDKELWPMPSYGDLVFEA